MTERDYVVVQEGAKQATAGEWREVTLGDVCHSVRYGYTASATDSPTGTRFLRVTDVAKGSLNWNTVPYCDIDDDQFYRFNLQPGDIVIARMGTIGVSALIDRPVRAVPASYLIRHRIDEAIADPRFVSYVLRSPVYWQFIHSYGSAGAVQPNINTQVLSGFEFPLPPLPEQRAIAHVLGTLDDKIELNRRMNETLEAMARALFTSWFVDFEPVRAKMEGRWRRGESLPGLPADLYDLFPDRLVDSELGEVPEGWEVGTVNQLSKRIQNGGTPKRSEPTYWEPRDIPWLTSGEVRQSFVLDTQDYISRRGLEHSSAKMISARSVLVALYGATAGQVSMNICPLTTNQAVSAIFPSDGNRYFCLVSLKLQVGELGSRAIGSAQQNLSKQAVESTNVVLPPIELRAVFDTIVEGSFERIFANLSESRTLAAQRDTLLPRLVSGDVEMDDIQGSRTQRN